MRHDHCCARPSGLEVQVALHAAGAASAQFERTHRIQAPPNAGEPQVLPKVSRISGYEYLAGGRSSDSAGGRIACRATAMADPDFQDDGSNHGAHGDVAWSSTPSASWPRKWKGSPLARRRSSLLRTLVTTTAQAAPVAEAHSSSLTGWPRPVRPASVSGAWHRLQRRHRSRRRPFRGNGHDSRRGRKEATVTETDWRNAVVGFVDQVQRSSRRVASTQATRG